MPMVFQGVNDVVQARQMMYHAGTDAIVIGGHSQDTTVIPSITTDTSDYYPMIYYIQGNPKARVWTKYLNQVNAMISTITTDGVRIFAMTDLDQFLLVDVTGTLLKVFQILSLSPRYYKNARYLLLSSTHMYIQQRSVLTVDYRIHFNKVPLTISAGGSASCTLQCNGAHSVVNNQAIVFNADQSIIWTSYIFNEAKLALHGIITSNCQVLSPTKYFDVGVADTYPDFSLQLRFFSLTAESKNMLTLVYQKPSNNFIYIIRGLQDISSPFQFSFDMRQNAAAYPDYIFLDIQAVSSNLIFVALIVQPQFKLAKISFTDNTMTFYQALPPNNFEYATGSFKYSGPSPANQYYYTLGVYSTILMSDTAASTLHLTASSSQLLSTDPGESYQTYSPGQTGENALTTVNITLVGTDEYVAISASAITLVSGVTLNSVSSTNPTLYDFSGSYPTPPIPTTTITATFTGCLGGTFDLTPYRINNFCLGTHDLLMPETTLPNWLSFTAGTMQLDVSPNTNLAGTYSVVYRKTYYSGGYDERYIDVVLEDTACLRFISTGTLVDQTVTLTQSLLFDLPQTANFATSSVTVTLNPVYDWISNSWTGTVHRLNIGPYAAAHTGEWPITITLKSGSSTSIPYKLKIIVQNLPPTFDKEFPSELSVPLLINSEFMLPNKIDLDGHLPISQNLEALDTTTPCMTLLTDRLSMFCTDSSLIGTTDKIQHYRLVLTDFYSAKTEYLIALTILTEPAKFIFTPPNIKLHLNEAKVVYLPPIYSVFNEDKISILHETLPNFIEYHAADRYYTLNPIKQSDLGNHQITLTLQVPTMNQEYSFLVKVVNDPPVMAEAPIDQNILFGTTTVYKIPTIIDPEGMKVKLEVSYEGSEIAYLQFNQDGVFTFNPTLESEIDATTKVCLKYSDELSPPSFAYFTIKVYKDLETLNKAIITGADNNHRQQNQTVHGPKQAQQILGLKISKVTRDGKISIRVLGGDAKTLINSLDIKDLSVMVLENSFSERKNVEFTISELLGNQIDIKVSYPNRISNSNVIHNFYKLFRTLTKCRFRFCAPLLQMMRALRKL
ncbi:hypothetical protein FGO68_gene1901 [Halteria grandinella]|uniref:Uncharacterized protein n=1 Tax=Halteria grandinella TaxID=5974 RepID=A0A8J8NHU5_HALGN|nr:hypothetical protein FGO68_gene1901 [Halteria grandinella]